jgi:hypothetical protein
MLGDAVLHVGRRHEQERRLEQERYIATARARLKEYVGLGELTTKNVEDIVALLSRDETQLLPRA